MELTWPCPHCARWQNEIVSFPLASINCPECHKPQLTSGGNAFRERGEVKQCPACGTEHLFRQKDFNRKLGIGLLVLGIALAYWTYGISLLAVTLIDWLLYKNVGEVGCCYRCQAQIRKTHQIKNLAPFDLKLHDYYRSLRS
jgi:hypothetical protein